MANIAETTVDMSDVAKHMHLGIVVKVKHSRRFIWRYVVAKMLIRLAARVIPTGCTVDWQETP